MESSKEGNLKMEGGLMGNFPVILLDPDLQTTENPSGRVEIGCRVIFIHQEISHLLPENKSP